MMRASSMPHCCSGAPCRQARRVERHRRPRPAQPGPGWSLPAGRSRGGTTPAWRCATLARPIPLSVAGARWPERSLHIAGPAARRRSRVARGTREHHPAARMLSIMAATSSISRRSSSPASSAATSAARTARRCRRAALSRPCSGGAARGLNGTCRARLAINVRPWSRPPRQCSCTLSWCYVLERAKVRAKGIEPS